MPVRTHPSIYLLIFVGLILLSCNEAGMKSVDGNPKNETKMEKRGKKEKVLRHVVLFKFNDESSKEDIDQLNSAFNALPKAIPEIKDFEWGLNDSPENFHQGFTHCYLLTFDSEEDRDSIYSPHPQHKAFVASLQPHLEKVFVVDYWTNP